MTNKATKLKEVLSIQTTSGMVWDMTEYLIGKATDNGWHVEYDEHNENVYITKGAADIYPCIVAHTDTVHDIESAFEVIQANGNFMAINPDTMTQTGVGGDDKVGVWVALRCLETLPACKAAFFSDEEIGCVGSSFAKLDFFDNCAFVLQCDRRGNADFIDNASGVALSSKQFKAAIKYILKGHGYKIASGAMTDVMQLKEDGLNICAANISCGYYRPHSFDEYVVIADADNCLSLVLEICEKIGGQQWQHKPAKRDYNKKYWQSYKQQKTEYQYSTIIYDHCDFCGQFSIETQYDNNSGSYLCRQCKDWSNDVNGII